MRRIVVAESEPFLARMLRLALTRSGYRVKVVADGDQALEMILAEPPEALVASADLPGKSGLELCRRMHAELPHREIPAILMSARADQAIRRDAQMFNRVIVLDHPVSVRNLLSRLESFFAGDSMVDTLVGEDRVR